MEKWDSAEIFRLRAGAWSRGAYNDMADRVGSKLNPRTYDMAFSITRSIGVDYGHRVMTHGSKCKSIHGHRGTIEVTCTGSSLHQSGEQSEMVLDFGFLKEVMMNVIDKSIDHGFVACIDDKELLAHLLPSEANPIEPIGYIKTCLDEQGYWLSTQEQK